MKLFFGFIIVVFISSSTSTPFEKCKNVEGPKAVRVHGCTHIPCELHRGKNHTVEMDFVTKERTKSLKQRIRTFVLGHSFVFPRTLKDGCSTLLKNSKCPLQANEHATHALTMSVQETFPKVNLTIEFSFVDGNDNGIVCYAIPFQAK